MFTVHKSLQYVKQEMIHLRLKLFNAFPAEKKKRETRLNRTSLGQPSVADIKVKTLFGGNNGRRHSPGVRVPSHVCAPRIPLWRRNHWIIKPGRCRRQGTISEGGGSSESRRYRQTKGRRGGLATRPASIQSCSVTEPDIDILSFVKYFHLPLPNGLKETPPRAEPMCSLEQAVPGQLGAYGIVIKLICCVDIRYNLWDASAVEVQASMPSLTLQKPQPDWWG